MVNVGFIYNFEDTNKQLIEQLGKNPDINIYPLWDKKPTAKTVAEKIPENSFLIWRILPEHTHNGYNPVPELEQKGYKVLNNYEASQKADDKLETFKILTENKIPTIPTWECAAGSTIPVNHIVKPRKGLKGKYVLYGQNTVEEIFEPIKEKALATEVDSWIMQPYIPSSGKWLRVIVVGGEAILAYRRIPASGRNIANVNQGAKREQVPLTESLKKLAEKTAAILKLDITGLDITHHPHIIVEANSIPAVPNFAVKRTAEQLTKLLKQSD